jgi:hypothetical protein
MRNGKSKRHKMLRGFARVHLKDLDGNILKERTMENQFTNGFRTELLSCIGDGGAVASNVGCISVGTGGAVTGSHTSLPGELATNADADTTVSSSSRLRVTGSFASNHNTGNISNMGLHSHTANASLICGNTFAASFAKATNQTLSVTYDITFSS